MKPRNQLVQLRRIAQIRDLQCTGAQARTGEAAAVRGEAERESAVEAEKLQLVAEGWQAALAAPMLAVDLLALWSGELIRQDDVRRDAESRLREAQAELDLRHGEWARALACRDAAYEMTKAATRRHARAREEKLLGDATDRHMHRRHAL